MKNKAELILTYQPVNRLEEQFRYAIENLKVSKAWDGLDRGALYVALEFGETAVANLRRLLNDLELRSRG